MTERLAVVETLPEMRGLLRELVVSIKEVVVGEIGKAEIVLDEIDEK